MPRKISWRASGLMLGTMTALMGACEPDGGSPDMATPVRVTGTVTSAGVPAPDYLSDVSGLELGVDSNGITELPAFGQITITLRGQSAQGYLISQSDPGSTIQLLNAFYQGSIPNLITGSPVVIPAAKMQLPAGTTLPTQRFMILANTVGSGVSSYQLIRFSFIL